MITGVQDVYYEVQDMKRAVAFYRNVLNLAVTEESEHWSAMTWASPRRARFDGRQADPEARDLDPEDRGYPSRREETARQGSKVRRGDRRLSLGECRDIRRF